MSSVVLGASSTAFSVRTQRTAARPARRSVSVRAQAGGPEAAQAGQSQPAADVCPGCSCPKALMECDGTGRQIGGMAAIPLFEWWPIKAYRPCPALVRAGGTYTKCVGRADSGAAGTHTQCQCDTTSQRAVERKGQELDEVMFGRMKGKQ